MPRADQIQRFSTLQIFMGSCHRDFSVITARSALFTLILFAKKDKKRLVFFQELVFFRQVFATPARNNDLRIILFIIYH